MRTCEESQVRLIPARSKDLTHALPTPQLDVLWLLPRRRPSGSPPDAIRSISHGAAIRRRRWFPRRSWFSAQPHSQIANAPSRRCQNIRYTQDRRMAMGGRSRPHGCLELGSRDARECNQRGHTRRCTARTASTQTAQQTAPAEAKLNSPSQN